MIPEIKDRIARTEGAIKEIDEGIRNLAANLSELREQLQIERAPTCVPPTALRDEPEYEPTGCVPKRSRY